MQRTTALASLLAALFAAAPALAMEATQRVEREVVTTAPDGTQQVSRLPADAVVPGEIIVYTLDYVNTDAEPATDLVLAMPVPAEIVFAEGSADRSGAVVEYSADGGASFSDRFTLTVVDADGMQRAAEAADISAVRWRLAEPVAPGESGMVSFKGRLR